MEHRLGAILIERGVLTASQVKGALDYQENTGEPLGLICERLYEVTPEEIEAAWAAQYATLAKEGRTLNQREVRFLSMRAKDRATFGPHSIALTCELPAAGTYRISLDAVSGPEQGKVQLFVDEAPAGPTIDLYGDEHQVANGEYAGTLELEQGPNHLMFKLVGQNEKSRQLGFDLTNIVCERTR